ncbi:glycosyltransferase, partial [bacterium]|nr:glycosyltransferase [bacterium]
MKILQSTIRYYPALGGAEEYVRRISEGLAQRGHEIKVFTSDLKESVGTDRLKAGREMIGGIAVNRHRAFCLGFKKY